MYNYQELRVWSLAFLLLFIQTTLFILFPTATWAGIVSANLWLFYNGHLWFIIIFFRRIIIFFFVISLSGCTSIKAVFSMTKSTDHFIELERSPAIKYEKGSMGYALIISNYLNKATKIVETKQFGPFPDEVTVYVPNTIDSFASYCVSKKPSACVIGNRLFMSPKLLDDDERISKILNLSFRNASTILILGFFTMSMYYQLFYEPNIPIITAYQVSYVLAGFIIIFLGSAYYYHKSKTI